MRPDWAEVLWAHLPSDVERDCIDGDWVYARRCDCGWHGLSEDHITHLAAVLDAALADWLGADETQMAAAKAVLDTRRHRWESPHQGHCILDARAALATLTERTTP